MMMFLPALNCGALSGVGSPGFYQARKPRAIIVRDREFAMLLLNTKSIGIADHAVKLYSLSLPRIDIDDYAVEYFL